MEIFWIVGLVSFFVNEVLGKSGAQAEIFMSCVPWLSLDVVRVEIAPGGTCERYKRPMGLLSIIGKRSHS